MNIYVILLIQMLIAGGTHIVAKSVVHHVDALTLTFIRGVLSAAGFLFLLAWNGKNLRLPKKNRPLTVFLGFLCVLNQYLYLYGLNYTSAANGALLYATTPISVLVLSRIIYRERLTLQKTIGIVLAFIGVVIVVFERGISTSSEFIFGNIMVFIAVICWALYTVLGKSVVIEQGALKAAGLTNLIGFAMLVPFGLFSAASFPLSSLSSVDWAGVCYLGFVTSILSYLLWYIALRRIDASRLAVFTNGQPITATLLAVVFLHYVITAQFVIGGIITISGVVLTQLKS